jgi:hypothetical protein
LSAIVQPGTAAGATSSTPGGVLTAIFTVSAVGSSVGTRSVSVGCEPSGSTLGCRLTCACALAGSAPAASAAAYSTFFFIDRFLGTW